MLDFKRMCCKKTVSKTEKSGDAPLLCPRCAIKMDKETKGDVTIDICGKCHGMWLDDNEIERLLSQSRAKNHAASSAVSKRGEAKKRKR